MEILGMDFIDEEIHKFSYYFCVKPATSAPAPSAPAAASGVSIFRAGKCGEEIKEEQKIGTKPIHVSRFWIREEEGKKRPKHWTNTEHRVFSVCFFVFFLIFVVFCHQLLIREMRF